MTGLEAYDEETPAGGDNVNQGDNKIRELAQKTKTSVDAEHHLSGEHNIPRGTTGDKPAATKDGRLFILENSGVEAELQYANGAIWTGLSKNQIVTTMQTDITTIQSTATTHKTANPIDHPDLSIAHGKIISGDIRRKHLNSGDGNPTGSIANLINGTQLPSDGTWHTHPAPAGDPLGITYLANIVSIASGSSDVGWTTKDLTSSGVPSNAKAAILQANGTTIMDSGAAQTQCKINIRKNSSSDELWLIGSMYNDAYTNIGMRGQGTYPLDTGEKLDYLVAGYNVSWNIHLIGYIV